MNTNTSSGFQNASFYDGEFYKGQKNISRNSAREIIPHLQELFQPESVVDVGCGVGTWLSVWKEMGVNQVLGIDGDYVDRSQLQVEPAEFKPYDLTTPLHLDATFDLATSFEVGEHIPDEFARTFIDNICSLSKVVAFSAALPGQGGTNHINEQWPEYWAAHFAANGFEPVDCLRSRIWENEKIGYYYRQNIIVFIHRDAAPRYADIRQTESGLHSLVHPETLNKRVTEVARLRTKLHHAETDVYITFKNFRQAFLKKIREKLGLNK